MAPDLGALSIQDLVDRQAVAYRMLADVQGEIARRAAPGPQAPQDPDRTLDPQEAAALLGMGRRALLAAARGGRLPSVKVSHKVVRFSERALRRWQAARTR